MKKLIAILLALSLLFAFAACGFNSDDEDIRGKVSVSDDDADDTTDAEESEETTEAEKEFSIGKTNNNVWENEYMGLGCSLPSSWTFKTDEEMAQLNGYTQEYIPDKYADQMNDASVIYDMFANSSDGLSNVNVNLEKSSKANLINFDANEVIDTVIPIIEETYQNMGFNDVTTSTEKIRIDGVSLVALTFCAKMSGIELYGTSFMVKCSEHIASVTCVSTSESELQQTLDSFYWL